MNPTRRGFLTLLGAAAAGSLITSNEVLAALAPEDKFAVVIHQARAIIALTPAHIPSPKNPSPAALEAFRKTRDARKAFCQSMEFRPTRDLITQKTDDLLAYMLDNFGEPTQEDVDALFAKKVNGSLDSRDDLEQVIESVVPMAVLREMIQSHSVPYQTHEMKSMDRFFNRYTRFVMYRGKPVSANQPLQSAA